MDDHGRWKCQSFQVGATGKNLGRKFRIYAAIVDDSDVREPILLNDDRGQIW